MQESDTGAQPLPKSVELLWGLDVSGSRGPRRGLSLERIAEAAVELADADGIAALSMSRLAERLGFTTMSLYRYVDSKDTLIDVISDRVLGQPPEIASELPWRAALREWAWAEFAAIRRHPWWLDIPLAAPPMGPNNMAWLDRGLATLAGTEVPEPAKLQLLLNLSLYVVGRARFQRDTAATAQDSDFVAVMGRVLDPRRFPALTRALAASAFVDDEINWEEADFAFCLDRLLDGYEHFIEGLTANSAPPGTDDRA